MTTGFRLNRELLETFNEFVRFWVIPTLVCVIAFAVTIFVYMRYKESVEHPTVISNASTLSLKVHAGEPLKIIRTVIREKYCRTYVDNFIIKQIKSEDGRVLEVVVYRDSLVGGSARVGTTTSLVEVKVPDYLEPGPYITRTMISPQCGDNNSSMSEDLHFEVLPKTPQ